MLREQLSDARKREIEATRGQERARTELADASERAGELKVALDQSRSEVPPLRDALEAEKRNARRSRPTRRRGAPSSPPSARRSSVCGATTTS